MLALAIHFLAARSVSWARPILAMALLVFASPGATRAGDAWEAGFSKVDITPAEPVRLSGYGNRTAPHESVADPLHVRALVLRSAGGDLQVLVSVDTIGFPATLSDTIHRAVAERHALDRSDVVICGTHAHTAPQLAGGPSNLFATPLTADEEAATERYTEWVEQQTIAAIDAAVADLAPGRLHFGTGSADFARHRRVIKDGRWIGFGTDSDGPVDHSVPVLRIDDAEGRVRGIVFNYACHCTTLGPEFNRVSSDWAGYAAAALESKYAGAIAMPTIGCGADANPEPRGQLDMAKVHGRTLAQAVAKVLDGPMREITAAPTTAFGYAGLPVERQELDSFRRLTDDPSPQVRRHARNMLDIHQRMGRLPESYPAPVQTWRFGDQLAMVFLGGEVVSEYALRLAREISAEGVWVSAYANDLFGYVASERMRDEGGYEVDGSMIYYNHPGRWASGTEEVLIRRVHELLAGASTGPLAPEQAVRSFVVPRGYQVELVAAEPLISDPVNLAFDPDGSLWIVEMGDYPLGSGDADGAGGRIKRLWDEDRDGQFDSAALFLDGLSFPSGVFPWRDGVLVSAAPEIFFAKDTDGDGRADTREVLFSGFAEANPQHRVNGFAFGLDGWLYLAGGADNGEITAHRTGEKVMVGHRDFRLHPDRGTLQVLSGEAQYGRSRDAWGNWFGNSNSRPGYQYVMEDYQLQRNPHVALPTPLADLFDPPYAPPVFPASRTEDRFNDLSTANRFTSACSPLVYYPPSADPHGEAWMLVCEPVHNLVHRRRIHRDGVVFRGERLEDDAESEFIASTDNWSRPVRIAAGPDGAVWVVDMYRHVIEHPEWIPEHWQARLDLRAGEERGRIYRVVRDSHARNFLPAASPNLSRLGAAELIRRLQDPNGPLRDLAAQQLIARFGEDDEAIAGVRRVAHESRRPEARAQALGTLAAIEQLTTGDLRHGLADDHPDVLRFALRQVEQYGEDIPEDLLAAVRPAAEHADTGVRFAAALALSRFESSEAADLLADILRDSDDPSVEAAVLTSATHRARAILQRIAKDPAAFASRPTLHRDLFATALATDAAMTLDQLLASSAQTDAAADAAWDEAAAGAVLDYLHSRGETIDAVAGDGEGQQVEAMRQWLQRTCLAAEKTVRDEAAPLERRVQAVGLIARAESIVPDLPQGLADLLTPAQPYEVQTAIVSGLADRGSDAALGRLLDAVDGVSPRVRTQILLGLASGRRGAALVASRIEAGEMVASELDESVRDTLLSVSDPDLGKRLATLLESGAPAVERSEVVRQFEGIDPASGSPEQGAQVFSQHCAVCHRPEKDAPAIGPNLDGLTDRSTGSLLTAIFDPSAAIESRYRQYRILTVDGRLRTGIIIGESSTGVTLGKADGTTETVLRRDIEQIRSAPQSLMPNGLEQNLTRQQLTDLLAYLQQR